jgi:hypothetical protein
MQNQIDIAKHPYGLGGGTILTGSMSTSGDYFWFYPISSSVSTLKMADPAGTIPSTAYPNGVGVYGYITEITQSSGASIVYLGAPSEPRYNTFVPYPSLTPSITKTISVTPSATLPISVSVTPSISLTPSITPSITATPSITLTPSISRTPSISLTPSVTPSISKTPSITPSITPSRIP